LDEKYLVIIHQDWLDQVKKMVNKSRNNNNSKSSNNGLLLEELMDEMTALYRIWFCLKKISEKFHTNNNKTCLGRFQDCGRGKN
jgi:hypothetical protein